MRWTWIDRLIEFRSGQRARAIKNVAMCEEYFPQHFPGYPVMPPCLILEGMTQTAGLLVLEHFQFTRGAVLAKVSKVSFRFCVRPGDTLIYTATIDAIREEGVVCAVSSHRSSELHASGQVMLATLDPSRGDFPSLDREQMIRVMRMLKLFEVGIAADGSRLSGTSADPQ